ncbi:aryl-alcohol dehydrogenase-like predicted oxidoreductase [Hymenobacter luteus]|uniref:Aryl-alcohol dehydrogenase-like predicted oxidoreductase n=2 Tax=Hymenobacter TaxID=89966 RepID=A0A7W9WDJ4_9BACT|nr:MULTISPECIES: aldo/keto reductase [Hymenobacter]MBB4601834.1 aryl-alcohol dehydrogenase-like predicted oxidoreductase [Hymenobacter latericoloratus]MBB6059737.1 aryl-alcohol dehydrogenase-like predicted oxidoreductase [Hymenobacter luteus]
MATSTAPAATFRLGGDLTINRMGYGAMRITGDGIWGPPQDHDEAIRVLQRAVELGINFIDTADSYGPNVSEELIAEALHPYKSGLIIGTKGGLLRTGPNQWPIDASPNHLRQALEGSLQRLKLDQIDLYQLHRVDPEVPFEQTLEFLQQVQEEGLVKHIGLSEVTVEQIQQAQQYVKVVSVQNMYSVDNRKWEAELNFCEKNGLAFIPWYPLAGGNEEALNKLTKIGQKYNASKQQVALSWLLHRSPNILLIPGTSKVKHLEENVQAASLSLTLDDMAELENLGGSSSDSE